MKALIEFKWQLSLFTFLGILTILSSTTIFSTFVNADDLNPGIYSKVSEPFGISYGDWLGKYFQWFVGIPADISPREHYTPESCSIDQSGPVWFLTDILKGTEVRTCTVPSDKAIFLPILTGVSWDDGSGLFPLSEQDVINGATAGNEYGVLSATLDGRAIQDLTSYRAQSSWFNITVPENNIFNNPPGFYEKAIADGFFLFVESLPTGNHTLHFTVSVLNPIESEYNYAADLTYNLNVVNPEPTS